MASTFFKENGSLIKAAGTNVTLKLNNDDPANPFHNLAISTNLTGIDLANALGNGNMIAIKQSVANENMLQPASTPELYFTAADKTDIFLNIKIKINAEKTNHAGLAFLKLTDNVDKFADEA